MIPISDSVGSRRTPWVTGILVALCVALFLYELSLQGRALDAFVRRWGADPALLLLAITGSSQVPRSELLTLFTSQFLHGDWLHLLGNMVFLWVFGRAVEDRLGHLIYSLVYLLGGAGAALFHAWMTGWESGSVLIGASGAIATVLGAYLVSYPTAWVRVLVPILFFFWAFDVPAVLMLALWFFGQLFNGIASVTDAATGDRVAFWAHIGGFLIGLVAGRILPGSSSSGGRAGRGSAGPGPVGLVSSIATLAAVLLATRVVLRFLEVGAGRGLLGQIAGMVYWATNPLVLPIGLFVPRIELLGQPVELAALVAMLLVNLAAGVLVRALGGSPGRTRQ